MRVHKERRMARVLAGILAVCVLLTGAALAAEAPEGNACGKGLNWSLDESGRVLTISGQGPMYDYGGKNSGQTPWGQEIEEVVIRHGVTSIGVEAFQGCKKLVRVVIPDSVTSIGYAAFAGCTELSRVVLPASVSNVYAAAFAGCGKLSEIRLSQSMTQIWDNTFQGCGLTTVTIPANIRKISTAAFADCVVLNEVRFSGNAPEIASDAFENVSASCEFPLKNDSWTMSTLVNYGGMLSWKGRNLEIPFADVPVTYWGYPGIAYAYQENLLQGTDATHFSPAAAATRAQVIMALWRLDGAPRSGYALKFKDVAGNAPYAPAIAWAVEHGIVAGFTETRFAPEAPVTREQLAVMIYNVENKLHSNSGFEGPWIAPQQIRDMDTVSSWAEEAVRSMLHRGIFRGNSTGLLNPESHCSRVELAAILLRCSHQQGA